MSAESPAFELLYRRVDYERMARMPYGGELKLDRMRELLARLGSPHRGLPAVHITGTKGKGSTAAMVAAALNRAGHKTGLFTSPHLEHVGQRIAIDGRCCTPAETAALVEQVRPAVEAMDRAATDRVQPPTFFEVLTAMAFVHFRQQAVAAAVLEVGLGGRLDSTNVCEPLVSAITSVSLDHTQQLGTTLAAIAAEKAGIVKPGVPVVSGVTDDEPRAVIRKTAELHGAPLVELGVDFDFTYRPGDAAAAPAEPSRVSVFRQRPERTTLLADCSLALPGRHQAANAAVAVMIVERLRAAGWPIADEAVRAALGSLSWPGRVEVVARRPLVVLDVAHNAASVEALVKTLQEGFPARRRILVFATSQDKDVAGMLRPLLQYFDETILTRYTNNPRAAPVEELQRLASELSSRKPTVAASPLEAWEAARRQAGPEDLICVCGSFYLVAELRPLLVGPSR